jgi:hypothetical protein
MNISKYTEIFEYKNNNGKIILIKQYNDLYNILFLTNNTSFDCLNCRTGCSCDYDDWIKGTWDGLFLNYDNNSYEFIYNVYNFLLINFDKLSKFNRSELIDWKYNNYYTFLYKYYRNYIIYMNTLVKYYTYIGIFKKSFFDKLKDLYFNKYKSILDINITIDYIFNSENEDIKHICILFPNGLCIEYNELLNEDNTLRQISFNSINYINNLMNNLLEIDNYMIKNNYEKDDIVIFKKIENKLYNTEDNYSDIYDDNKLNINEIEDEYLSINNKLQLLNINDEIKEYLFNNIYIINILRYSEFNIFNNMIENIDIKIEDFFKIHNYSSDIQKIYYDNSFNDIYKKLSKIEMEWQQMLGYI